MTDRKARAKADCGSIQLCAGSRKFCAKPGSGATLFRAESDEEPYMRNLGFGRLFSDRKPRFRSKFICNLSLQIRYSEKGEFNGGN